MHKVVLKTIMPASWYSKDNSPAMVLKVWTRFLFPWAENQSFNYAVRLLEAQRETSFK